MKTFHTACSSNIKKGFTLVEMTVAILVGLMISAAALSLMNNQILTFNILKTQNFLVAEAPQINNTLNRIVSRGSFARLYPSFEDATASTNPTLTDADTLLLVFPSTQQSGAALEAPSFGVIAFDEPNNNLDYYPVADLASLNALDPDNSPHWNISNQVANINYFIQNGVLRIRVTGPHGGSIIYTNTTL